MGGNVKEDSFASVVFLELLSLDSSRRKKGRTDFGGWVQPTTDKPPEHIDKITQTRSSTSHLPRQGLLEGMLQLILAIIWPNLATFEPKFELNLANFIHFDQKTYTRYADVLIPFTEARIVWKHVTNFGHCLTKFGYFLAKSRQNLTTIWPF